MNFFLSDENYNVITRMRTIRTRPIEKDGKTSNKYRWLLGAQKCTVSNAEVRIAVNKKPYIVVEFMRKPETVYNRRLYFAPHEEFLTIDLTECSQSPVVEEQVDMVLERLNQKLLKN